MNIQFDCLYRDAGNNKQTGAIIFSGEKVANLDEVAQEIQKHLIDDAFFVASEIGVPPLSFDSYDVNLDHEWHEFIGVSWTDTPTTVADDFDIDNCIKLLSESKYQDELFGKKIKERP